MISTSQRFSEMYVDIMNVNAFKANTPDKYLK